MVRSFISVFCIGVALLVVGSVDAAPKRPLDHDAYARWQAIEEAKISAKGRWIVYNLKPGDGGDGRLIAQAVDGINRYTVERGFQARIDAEDEWVVCRIAPPLQPSETDGDHETDSAHAALGLLHLATGERETIADVLSFTMPEKRGGMVAWLHGSSADDDTTAGENNGHELVLRSLQNGQEYHFQHVLEYAFSPEGHWLAFLTHGAKKNDVGVYLVATDEGTVRRLLSGDGEYAQLAFDETGQHLAFVSNRDDQDAEQPLWSLYLWSSSTDTVRAIIAPDTPGMKAGWSVSPYRCPWFSASSRRLFFGTVPRPRDPVETPAPQVVVDVWSWTDDVIQPQQLVELANERQRSYLAVIDLQAGPGEVVQLGDQELPTIRLPRTGETQVAVGITDRPYRRSFGWDQQLYQDVTLVDINSGRRTQILQAQRGSFQLSPAGRYVWWWNGEQGAWFTMSTSGGAPVNVSDAIGFRVDNERHDAPSLPGPYGAAGWLSADAGLIIYDAYDLWLVDPEHPLAPRSITEQAGRRQHLRWRWIDLDPARQEIDPNQSLLLSALDLTSKDAGFWQDVVTGDKPPRRLLMQPRRFSRPVKAASADVMLMRAGSFETFDDLWTSDLKLGHRRRISNANPQQAEYLWGSAELVHYMSTDGTALQGILYKPENFDPSVRYPMITYFYERYADYLHQHYPPTPHRSIIRFPFYTSRGYLVFVPDISYSIGYPGPSAVNSIVPGVLKLIDQGFVNPDAIGLQGHSWGGYQAAFLITQTDLFACAIAGAVVSNMTSAYGGIRWQTGVSRMYKYEKTQSRIGGTLWEQTHRYLDNSPLFFADRVNTPLLMLHNDQDGAVPWYQGIEYFLALRRLGKPAWLLNYNGQPHWVTTTATQKDYAVRMAQFFDHYLQGKRPARWMVEGIPATEKGYTLGLELVE